MKLQPKGTGRRLKVSRNPLRSDAGWIDERGNDARCRNHFAQQLQPFWPQLHAQPCHTRYVATRPVQAGDKPQLDRIDPGRENDWNCCGRGLGREGTELYSSSQ